jgi:UDP-3-O-[3-hydroxymyristoyl] glucosamine N-acyltransferase
VAALFQPAPRLRPGVHPTAFVAESPRIDPSAEVGPFALVDAGAEVGARCRIGSHVTIAEGVVVGPDCRIGAKASLSYAVLGARVYIYPGARTGQEGFSFAPTESGFLSVPHLGRVVLGDDVEVGANATIDRGSTGDTTIGAGARLDNLVQIGHNLRLGRCCVIVVQVGMRARRCSAISCRLADRRPLPDISASERQLESARRRA